MHPVTCLKCFAVGKVNAVYAFAKAVCHIANSYKPSPFLPRAMRLAINGDYTPKTKIILLILTPYLEPFLCHYSRSLF